MYAILILGAFALWFAVRCLERGDLRDFLCSVRGAWASWPPLFRVSAAALLVCCTLDAQKPSGADRAAGGDAAAEAGTDAAPRTDTVETPPAQTGGDADARPLDGGGDGGLRTLWTLGDGTNCWWVAEGRAPADTDGDGMPDEWERLFGLDPLDPSDASGDHDRDGLTALEEFLNRIHPRRRDTDGDGMPDAWEAAHLPHLCPWLPDDTADADGDGLDNFHEHALGCDPGTPDTNGDGRADGEEAGEGVSPVLADADWAAYGTAEFFVRVQGLRAARRAGVSVGHVTHAGVSERTYALAAGYRYPVTVIDLDPDNTSACSGTVYIAHDTATFMHGFTNEFPVSFPLDPAAPACPPGTEMTVAGIDLDIPDIVQLAPDNSVSFAVAARFVPDGEEIAGTPHWSVSGGGASPASGGMETWVTVTFPETAARAPLDAGAETNSQPAVTVEVGDRKVTREVYPPVVPDPEDPAPWDNRRFIARSPGDSDPVELTYALLLSTNAVPFAWRGEPGDTVDWEIDGGTARFLVDGKEQKSVKGAQSVMVLPKGMLMTSTINAKCKSASGKRYTRQTPLRVIQIKAEPVKADLWNNGLPVNPSGFFVGGEARFLVEFAGNISKDHIHWSVAEGRATVGNADGNAPHTLTGVSAGTDTLTLDIEHYWGPPPKFNFEVYSPNPEPIPLHVGIIHSSNSVPAVSIQQVDNMIGLANSLFRQAGIRFQRVSVTNIMNDAWYDASSTNVQEQIRNCMSGTGGLEVYFTGNLEQNVYGSNNRYGIIIANNASDITLAHELGHACGWPDIYIQYGSESAITGPTSSALLPGDWNNGPGPAEYYDRYQTQAQLLTRLLMHGYPQGGRDIPSGSVYGVYRFSLQASSPIQGVLTTGLGPCGLDSLNRTPTHQ